MTQPTHDILRHWREAVPNDRMAHLIRDTERAFRRALQIRLAPYGVPFGHWSFLRILWETDGLTQKELSERAGVMEPTTFAAMKAMEALGYISRQQLPTNKKNVYVYLTPKGRALKDLLVPLAEETNRISCIDVAQPDMAVARKVLLAMIGNLAKEEAATTPPTAPQLRRRGRNGVPSIPPTGKRRTMPSSGGAGS
ncbi:MAG: MarR family transcriptional regulator [Rhodoferax sp.]|nr:MarR family transcriptional regulator [Rhodoferax sp.]MBP9929128.1 MarR family transcriptional regulator [Rhodoferax sp.]HQX58534.1 MarR family transcriptional regulator [Burkholderiaceae bacterium]HQZ05315.1 MarR family transcriptional regulator [Burkholderiaceae bacterium]